MKCHENTKKDITTKNAEEQRNMFGLAFKLPDVRRAKYLSETFCGHLVEGAATLVHRAVNESHGLKKAKKKFQAQQDSPVCLK